MAQYYYKAKKLLIIDNNLRDIYLFLPTDTLLHRGALRRR
jgi:hypothetical protein